MKFSILAGYKTKLLFWMIEHQNLLLNQSVFWLIQRRFLETFNTLQKIGENRASELAFQ